MPISPQQGSVVCLEISTSGTPVPDSLDTLSVHITSNVNRVGEARIVLSDGDLPTGGFPVSDSGTLVPGSPVEIRLGYDDKLSSLFKGLITGTRIQVDKDGSRLIVTCHDIAARMQIVKHSRGHHEVSDGQLIAQLCASYKIPCAVADTHIKHGKVRQSQISDFDFMVARASMNGLLVVTDSGQVRVEPPSTSQATLKVTCGDDLYDADLKLDALTQYQAFRVCCSDAEKEAFCEETSTEPAVNRQGNLTGKRLADSFGAGRQTLHTCSSDEMKHLQREANAGLLWSRLAKIAGHLRFRGNANAKPNSVIEINGLGDRHDGSALITGVTHVIEAGDWITKTAIGLTPDEVARMFERPIRKSFRDG